MPWCSERPTASPLDVPSIKADISTQEIVTLVRQERGRIRGWRTRPIKHVSRFRLRVPFPAHSVNSIPQWRTGVIAVIVGEPEKGAIIAATSGHTLIGPGSIPWEIGNAFSLMFKKGSLDVEDAQRGLEIFDSIPLQYVNVDMANVLSIASQVNAYAYDAYLLDCALRHTAPLLTLDQSLRRAANELNINLVNLEG